MKKVVLFIAALTLLAGCESELTNAYEVGQKPAAIKIKGYSNPDSVQFKLNGQPVLVGQDNSYSGNIETTVKFVVNEGEHDVFVIYSAKTGSELLQFDVNYDTIDDYKEIYFFNLPGIFLQTYAVKPAVSIGKVGFVFIFPNMGEFSGYEMEGVKGILKRENGTVLAEFPDIGKNNFSELKIFNYFSATAPVFLELYKPGTTEPYAGTEPIRVQIIQNVGANMIVLQEKSENGNLFIRGDIDVADYID